jgi:hypothetical protein
MLVKVENYGINNVLEPLDEIIALEVFVPRNAE